MIRIQSRPVVAEVDVREALQAHFELEGTLSDLPGERDRNFLLTCGDERRFVVKVSSPDEVDEILDIEVDLMRHLSSATDGFAPDVLASESGAFVVRFDDAAGTTHRLRVVDYIPGTVLANARPRTPQLLYDLGRRLAQLDSALGAYPDHPPARIDFDWALGRSGLVMERCFDLFAGPRLELIRSVHEAWARREADFLGLGSQVIHGDVNDHNVLVSPPGGGPRSVTGIIDLGDAHSAPRVFDLGIAVAYAMLETEDPLMAAAQVTRGFHEATPLSEEEVDVVYTLARARLGASVSISTWRRSESGEPDAYLTVSERPAWDALATLDRVPVRLAEGLLRDACGLPACPRSTAIVDWLASTDPAPVMQMKAAERGPIVMDLSVGSALLDGRDTDDTEAFSRRVFRALEDEAARVGIGRYLEPRAFYLTDNFAGRPGDARERRTIHLGVDVFDQAGAEVYAPLAGRVESVKDNAARLDYGPTVILRHECPAGPFWTLYGHLDRDSVASLEPGSIVTPGQLLARVGAPPDNGDWPPHLHLQIITDLLGFEGEFPGVALPRERSVWASFSPDPNLLLRLVESVEWTPPDELEERRHALVGGNVGLSYDAPLHIVRGAGSHLYDAYGRGYLDCVNNVAHVGHEHPTVVRAASDQTRVLNTNTRYLHEAILEYAERLTATMPDPLSVCYFVNSGSEANDLALRLARAHTGGDGVVVIESGYHGHTQTLIDVSPYKHDGPGGRGAPSWVRVVPAPDDYRGPHGRDVPDRAAKYASHVNSAFEALVGAGHLPAAFLAESLLSCGGQIEPPSGYLERAYAGARSAGAVCIADEVQIGFGRVGSHMWGFETQGVVPDIVTLGKPIGNGHPLGAVVTTRAIAESFDNGMEFFSTFGGNPVSCAVGLAVLDVLRAEGLRENAALVGGTLKGQLATLALRHDVIGDVRGRGLFLGVELVSDRTSRVPAPEVAHYVVNRAAELGVLLSTDGPHHNVLKIKPPMTFDLRDAERLVSTLDRILAEDGAAPRRDG